MSEAKWCQRQDSCPLLLGAIEAKVEAEYKARVAKHNQDAAAQAFETKRTLFNEFYKINLETFRAHLESARHSIGHAMARAAQGYTISHRTRVDTGYSSIRHGTENARR